MIKALCEYMLSHMDKWFKSYKINPTNFEDNISESTTQTSGLSYYWDKFILTKNDLLIFFKDANILFKIPSIYIWIKNKNLNEIILMNL